MPPIRRRQEFRLDNFDPHRVVTPNPPVDKRLLARLVEMMKARGAWGGEDENEARPLVGYMHYSPEHDAPVPHLLTGSHRAYAARQAGLRRIPVELLDPQDIEVLQEKSTFRKGRIGQEIDAPLYAELLKHRQPRISEILAQEQQYETDEELDERARRSFAEPSAIHFDDHNAPVRRNRGQDLPPRPSDAPATPAEELSQNLWKLLMEGTLRGHKLRVGNTLRRGGQRGAAGQDAEFEFIEGQAPVTSGTGRRRTGFDPRRYNLKIVADAMRGGKARAINMDTPRFVYDETTGKLYLPWASAEGVVRSHNTIPRGERAYAKDALVEYPNSTGQNPNLHYPPGYGPLDDETASEARQPKEPVSELRGEAGRKRYVSWLNAGGGTPGVTARLRDFAEPFAARVAFGEAEENPAHPLIQQGIEHSLRRPRSSPNAMIGTRRSPFEWGNVMDADSGERLVALKGGAYDLSHPDVAYSHYKKTDGNETDSDQWKPSLLEGVAHSGNLPLPRRYPDARIQSMPTRRLTPSEEVLAKAAQVLAATGHGRTDATGWRRNLAGVRPDEGEMQRQKRLRGVADDLMNRIAIAVEMGQMDVGSAMDLHGILAKRFAPPAPKRLNLDRFIRDLGEPDEPIRDLGEPDEPIVIRTHGEEDPHTFSRGGGVEFGRRQLPGGGFTGVPNPKPQSVPTPQQPQRIVPQTPGPSRPNWMTPAQQPQPAPSSTPTPPAQPAMPNPPSGSIELDELMHSAGEELDYSPAGSIPIPMLLRESQRERRMRHRQAQDEQLREFQRRLAAQSSVPAEIVDSLLGLRDDFIDQIRAASSRGSVPAQSGFPYRSSIQRASPRPSIQTTPAPRPNYGPRRDAADIQAQHRVMGGSNEPTQRMPDEIPVDYHLEQMARGRGLGGPFGGAVRNEGAGRTERLERHANLLSSQESGEPIPMTDAQQKLWVRLASKIPQHGAGTFDKALQSASYQEGVQRGAKRRFSRSGQDFDRANPMQQPPRPVAGNVSESLRQAGYGVGQTPTPYKAKPFPQYQAPNPKSQYTINNLSREKPPIAPYADKYTIDNRIDNRLRDGQGHTSSGEDWQKQTAYDPIGNRKYDPSKYEAGAERMIRERQVNVPMRHSGRDNAKKQPSKPRSLMDWLENEGAGHAANAISKNPSLYGGALTGAGIGGIFGGPLGVLAGGAIGAGIGGIKSLYDRFTAPPNAGVGTNARSVPRVPNTRGNRSFIKSIGTFSRDHEFARQPSAPQVSSDPILDLLERFRGTGQPRPQPQQPQRPPIRRPVYNPEQTWPRVMPFARQHTFGVADQFSPARMPRVGNSPFAFAPQRFPQAQRPFARPQHGFASAIPTPRAIKGIVGQGRTAGQYVSHGEQTSLLNSLQSPNLPLVPIVLPQPVGNAAALPLTPTGGRAPNSAIPPNMALMPQRRFARPQQGFDMAPGYGSDVPVVPQHGFSFVGAGTSRSADGAGSIGFFRRDLSSKRKHRNAASRYLS